MAKVKKNTRLITNRNFPDGKSVEWIEITENGGFLWVSEDWSMYKSMPSEEAVPVCGSCPVTLEFVEDMFEKQGRKLDVSRLPQNYMANPYSQWM